MKRIKTHPTSDDIKDQSHNENATMKVKGADRIISRCIVPTTLEVVTSKYAEGTHNNRHSRQKTTGTGAAHLQSVAMFTMLEGWHTRANCRSAMVICRCCVRTHPYSQCPMVKEETKYENIRQNSNRCCASCHYVIPSLIPSDQYLL